MNHVWLLYVQLITGGEIRPIRERPSASECMQAGDAWQVQAIAFLKREHLEAIGGGSFSCNEVYPKADLEYVRSLP